MRSDIALLRRPLISRHLQFSRLAIHPYFALRHASSNERLWSLPATLPRFSPCHPVIPAQRVRRNHKAWWLVLLLLRAITPAAIDYFVVLSSLLSPLTPLVSHSVLSRHYAVWNVDTAGVARALTASNESAITLSEERSVTRVVDFAKSSV